MAEPELGARLQRRFPDVVVEPLRELAVGFGSVVVETSDGIIFRVARHEAAAAGQAREFALLRQLRGRVSVAVPRPEWRIEPGQDFRFGAIGYRKLPGTRLEPGEETGPLALDLASFLRELHQLRDVDAERVGDVRELTASTVPVLRELLEPFELERLEQWYQDLVADDALFEFEPVLRHGDLWYGNLLVEDGRLAGVLDWGAAGFGDAAEDFAPLRHLSDAFAEMVLDAYGADHSLRRRERRHWELRELYGVRLALVLNDAEELADSLRKLRAGPVLARRSGE